MLKSHRITSTAAQMRILFPYKHTHLGNSKYYAWQSYIRKLNYYGKFELFMYSRVIKIKFVAQNTVLLQLFDILHPREYVFIVLPTEIPK
jgi:hypothetical protein